MGEVPEWLNGAVSKTVRVFMALGGSNPSLSAKDKIKEKRNKKKEEAVYCPK